MSIKVMVHYLDNSLLTGNDKLTMIILADYANDEGECYPGHKRIAHRLNMTVSGARKLLYRLRDVGEIEILTEEGVHTKNGNTNRYRLLKYIESLQGVPDGRLSPAGQGRVSPAGQGRVSPARDTDPSVVTLRRTVSSSRAQKSAAPTPSDTHSIIAAYIEVRGKNGINYGKEGSFAKKIIKDGYSPEQVKGCYLWMKTEPWWLDKPVTLDVIFKHLPEYTAWVERTITPIKAKEDTVIDIDWSKV